MDNNSKKNSRKKKSSKRLRQKGTDGNPLNGSTQQVDNPSNKARRNRKNSQSKMKMDHAIKNESNEEHTKALDQKLEEEIPLKENEIEEKENAVKSKGVSQVNEGDEPTTETTVKDQNDQTEHGRDQEEKDSNEQQVSKEIENVKVEQVQPEPAQSEPAQSEPAVEITVTVEGGETIKSPAVEDLPSLTTPRLAVAKRARRVSRPPSKQFFQRLREESDTPTVSPQTYLSPEPTPMLNSPRNSSNPRHSTGQQLGHALQNRAQNRGSLQLGGNPLAMEALQVKLKPTKSKESQEELKGDETQPKEAPTATLKQNGTDELPSQPKEAPTATLKQNGTDELPSQPKEMSAEPLEEKGEEIESNEEGKERVQEPLEDPLRMAKRNPGCRCIIC